MDRELTDHERSEYQKKYKHPKKRIRISYRSVIVFLLLIGFGFTPLLVEVGLKRLGISLDQYVEPTISQAHPNEAILQVYAARTWGPKGMFAVHTWIAMKRTGNQATEVSQIIGWRQGAGGNVLFRETNVPVNNWWGNEGTLLVDLHGEAAAAIIDKVDAAINAYPWKNEYTLYPGPNSNTFVSWIGLKVPELGLDLPSTAIGKDWRPLEESLGASASGTGVQASLFGMLGTSIGLEEGLEVNILGLNFELDLFDLALEIPLFGRYEIWYLLFYACIWFIIRKPVNGLRTKYIEWS